MTLHRAKSHIEVCLLVYLEAYLPLRVRAPCSRFGMQAELHELDNERKRRPASKAEELSGLRMHSATRSHRRTAAGRHGHAAAAGEAAPGA